MAIPSFCESFRAADFSQFSTRYDYASAGSGAVITTTGGRGGGRGLQNGSGAGAVHGKAIAAGNTSIVVGIRFNNTTSAAKALFVVRHEANAVNHLTMMINTSGFLELRRGTTTGTLLATSTTFVPNNTLTSVNLKASINSSTGSFSVEINGLAEASMAATGQNTQSGASADITSVYIGSPTNPPVSIIFNDFFFIDGSNSLPGDIYVDYLGVTGAGNYQQFTPSTGTNHAALLDEIPPNTTDYVSSSTNGHKETNTLADLSGSSLTIKFLQSVNYALKSDAGSALMQNMIRSGSTDANSGTFALSETARYYVYPHDVDPATSAAWASSAVNALEVGAQNVT